MDEQVLGLVIRRDEAKALLVAEPLDGSGSHLRFLLRSLVLRAPRLLSKSYDRWHCDVGRITRPDLATVAAFLRSRRLQPLAWHGHRSDRLEQRVGDPHRFKEAASQGARGG